MSWTGFNWTDQHPRFVADVTGDGRRRAGRRRRDPGYAADCRPGQVKHVTARQRNVAVAEEAGYGRFVDLNCVACIDMPGMCAVGVRYVNGSLVGEGKVGALMHPAAYQARLPRSPTGVRLMIGTRPQAAGRG
jgi:hypothetical protein